MDTEFNYLYEDKYYENAVKNLKSTFYDIVEREEIMLNNLENRIASEQDEGVKNRLLDLWSKQNSSLDESIIYFRQLKQSVMIIDSFVKELGQIDEQIVSDIINSTNVIKTNRVNEMERQDNNKENMQVEVPNQQIEEVEEKIPEVNEKIIQPVEPEQVVEEPTNELVEETNQNEILEENSPEAEVVDTAQENNVVEEDNIAQENNVAEENESIKDELPFKIEEYEENNEPIEQKSDLENIPPIKEQIDLPKEENEIASNNDQDSSNENQVPADNIQEETKEVPENNDIENTDEVKPSATEQEEVVEQSTPEEVKEENEIDSNIDQDSSNDNQIPVDNIQEETKEVFENNDIENTDEVKPSVTEQEVVEQTTPEEEPDTTIQNEQTANNEENAPKDFDISPNEDNSAFEAVEPEEEGFVLPPIKESAEEEPIDLPDMEKVTEEDDGIELPNTVETDSIDNSTIEQVPSESNYPRPHKLLRDSEDKIKAIVVNSSQYKKLIESLTKQEEKLFTRGLLTNDLINNSNGIENNEESNVTTAPITENVEQVVDNVVNNTHTQEDMEMMLEKANELYKSGKVNEAQALYDEISALNNSLKESNNELVKAA